MSLISVFSKCADDNAKPPTNAQLPDINAENHTESHSISILYWNIQGIDTKLEDPIVQKFLFKYSIIILAETWKDGNFKISIPNYDFQNFPRNNIHSNARRQSGGMAVFIHDSILKGVKWESRFEGVLWLKLKSEFFKMQRDQFIMSLYFPPGDSTYIPDMTQGKDYFQVLHSEYARYMSLGDIFIVGDINARTGLNADFDRVPNGNDRGSICVCDNDSSSDQVDDIFVKRYSKDKSVNTYGRRLLEFCRFTGIRILNGRLFKDKEIGDYTHIDVHGYSVIDYLLSLPSTSRKITDFEIQPKLADSDHRAITFSLCQKILPNNSQSPTAKETTSVYKWDIHKLPMYIQSLKGPEFEEISHEILLSIIDKDHDSNSICKLYYKLLETALNGIFLRFSGNRGNSKFPQNQWFDNECKELKRTVNDYAKEHDLKEDDRKAEYLNLCKEYKRVRQAKKRSYQDELRDALDSLNSNNPNDYWKVWKSFKPKSQQAAVSLEEFHKYFEDQTRPPHQDFFDTDHMEQIHSFINTYMNDIDSQTVFDNLSDDICNGPVTMKETKIHILRLKNNKAAGADGIPGEFIKFASDQLCETLNAIFNFVFEHGDYPDVWVDGYINPCHKKGPTYVPDNYRKITVMSCTGKVFESILNARLQQRNVIMKEDDPNQFGFKENCRTTDNIFILKSLVDKQKFKNKPLYTCFVDFTKAFDYIDRLALYYKLIKRGIHGKILKVIHSMYVKSKCRVKLKGELSDYIESEYGVLQGGMISPHLFTEFLYDLKEHLDKYSGIVVDDTLITYVLYADDLILCSDTESGLQKLLDGLFEYCKKWHLIVSLSKTKVIVFNQKRNTAPPIFRYNQEVVEIVEEYKYLGIPVTCKNNIFQNAYPYLATQAQKAIFSLNSNIHSSVNHLSIELSLKMFDNQIAPILDYASDVWYPGKIIKDIEKVQLMFMKQILGVNTQTCTQALYAETGRFPLHVRYAYNVLKYWMRLLTLPCDNTVKRCYITECELFELGQSNWCYIVKCILSSIEMQEAWEVQYFDTILLAEAKEKLYSNFMNMCIAEIQDPNMYPKLRTYRKFKNEYKMERYLMLKNIKHVKFMAKFRLSSHTLRIETGRHERPKLPAEERLCSICNLNLVEDELHFVMICDVYSQERDDLFVVCNQEIHDFESMNETDKFNEIMSSKLSDVIIALSKYIYACFTKRSNLNNDSMIDQSSTV